MNWIMYVRSPDMGLPWVVIGAQPPKSRNIGKVGTNLAY